MTNTTSNWLRFDAFLREPAESTRRCADSTSRLHGDGYGDHAYAQSEHGEPWRYTIRGVSLAGMTSAALDARENASMPPRESHGRRGPVGKTGISITASSISSDSLTAVLVRLTTLATVLPPLATRHYSTDYASLAPRLLPSAGNWVRFSCSIPPLFVLSHSMPMTNTTGKLALFYPRFSPATRHYLLRPSPAGYCLPPTVQLPITERGPISTSKPSISLCRRTRRFLRTNPSVPSHSPPLTR